jgi:predicted nuclease with RNAse H fold
MHVVGIDLSGPSNTVDTVIVAFDRHNSGLELQHSITGGTDSAILGLVAELAAHSNVAVGIDAPLSYNLGGGDRPADAELRRHIIDAGMPSGAVMAPTLNRMVYLTLRGLSVARLLLSIRSTSVSVVEVHPGAAMALRNAPIEAVRTFKDSGKSRWELLNWLQVQGLHHVATSEDPSDHYVAACGAALAAGKWQEGRPVWSYAANAPFHPFDFAC